MPSFIRWSRSGLVGFAAAVSLAAVSLAAVGCGSGEPSVADPTVGGGGVLGGSGGSTGDGGTGPQGGAPTGGSGGTGGANNAGTSNGGATASGGNAGATSSGGNGGSGGAGGNGGGSTAYVEPADPAGSWRSALFPRGWVPVEAGGKADSKGRFLPDFSYAGYHRGEQKPPFDKGAAAATVDAKLGDGKTSATAGIQAAIDSVCKAGGGVVSLPAGTYKVALPTAGSAAAITINCSRLVLRGAGPSNTRILFDDAARARSKSVITMGGGGSLTNGTAVAKLTADTVAGQSTIQLASTTGLAVGSWVVVRADVTPEFRKAHRMDMASNGEAADFWPNPSFTGLYYPRKIKALSGTTVTLDIPLRYPLKLRDNARVDKLGTYVEESGIEHLAVGMVQLAAPEPPATEGTKDEQYSVAGTTEYKVHDSRAVNIGGARDSWVYDVASFEPTENGGSGVHVLSHGLQLGFAAFRVHVQQCSFGRPEYRGGGGNGYLYHVQGSDNVIVNSSATNARHGLTMNQACSGNVFKQITLNSSRLTDDSHRFLANANLFDQLELNGAWLSAVNRGNTSTGAGFTSTASVYWNAHVAKLHSSAKGCAVETAQWDWGYVIGTSAAAGQSSTVCTAATTNGYWAKLDQGDPVDFVEGEGLGATLSPASLYDAQRARRCAVETLACD